MVEEPEDTAAVDPDDEGIILDASSALAQAANVLVSAAEKAEMLNDTQALMKIAGGWMEIHEYLAGVDHHQPRKQPLGFAPAAPNDEEEEVEELDDAIAATEGRSIGRIHAQHGKFRVAPRGRVRRG